MIDELYLYSYANEPNKSPWRERLGALLPLRETATFPPQADHVLVVFFFGRGGTWGAALKPPDIWRPNRDLRTFRTCTDQRLRATIATASSMVDPGDCVKDPPTLQENYPLM